MKYPLLVPTMPTAAQLHPYLQKIDDNRWYTNFGPLNSELEARLGHALQVKEQGLAITSMAECTAGLELALQAHGLPAGARVLTPSLTFVATGTAIVRSGHTPVFADVDPASWILTPAVAEAALATLPSTRSCRFRPSVPSRMSTPGPSLPVAMASR